MKCDISDMYGRPRQGSPVSHSRTWERITPRINQACSDADGSQSDAGHPQDDFWLYLELVPAGQERGLAPAEALALEPAGCWGQGQAQSLHARPQTAAL